MENYKLLLDDKSFSGIMVALDKNSNIMDANDEFLTLLGFTLKEIYMKNIIDLIVPDEKTLYYDLSFTQDISNRITLKFYHKTGAFRFFSFSVFRFSNYNMIIGNTLKKDFLAKKYDYVANRKNWIENIFDGIEVDNISDLFVFDDNPLKMLLDIMPVELWVKDKLSKYVFINETYKKATGINLEDCVGKDDYQLFSNETAKSFDQTDQLTIESRKKTSYVFETTDDSLASFAEVTKIPVYNKEKNYIGILGFSVNMSHIKASEKELSSENVKLMSVLDNIDGIVIEIDAKGEILFMKGKLKNALGFNDYKNLSEVIDNNPSTIGLREKIQLCLNGERIVSEINVQGKRVLYTLNPVKNNDGSFNVIGFGNIVSQLEKNND